MSPAAGSRPLPQGVESQRFGATLTLSVLVHVMVLAGIGFSATEPAAWVPTLDVIFSQAQTALTPEQADFLAAARNAGGGTEEKAHRPRDNQNGDVPRQSPGTAPLARPATSPPLAGQTQATVVSSRNSAIPLPAPRPRTQPSVQTAADPRVQRQADMARLAAEISQRSEQYARRPNRKFVSASTQEYAYANYLRSWVDKAERVGNLNYPDQARQRRLGGRVVITVGVRRDGSVESARVLRSSGIPLLDDAALRIVDLAAPFPPLPETGDGVDVLQVTRTWSFLPDGDLQDIGR